MLDSCRNFLQLVFQSRGALTEGSENEENFQERAFLLSNNLMLTADLMFSEEIPRFLGCRMAGLFPRSPIDGQLARPAFPRLFSMAANYCPFPDCFTSLESSSQSPCSACKQLFCPEHQNSHQCGDPANLSCPVCRAALEVEKGEDADKRLSRHLSSDCQDAMPHLVRRRSSKRSAAGDEEFPRYTRSSSRLLESPAFPPQTPFSPPFPRMGSFPRTTRATSKNALLDSLKGPGEVEISPAIRGFRAASLSAGGMPPLPRDSSVSSIPPLPRPSSLSSAALLAPLTPASPFLMDSEVAPLSWSALQPLNEPDQANKIFQVPEKPAKGKRKPVNGPSVGALDSLAAATQFHSAVEPSGDSTNGKINGKKNKGKPNKTQIEQEESSALPELSLPNASIPLVSYASTSSSRSLKRRKGVEDSAAPTASSAFGRELQKLSEGVRLLLSYVAAPNAGESSKLDSLIQGYRNLYLRHQGALFANGIRGISQAFVTIFLTNRHSIGESNNTNSPPRSPKLLHANSQAAPRLESNEPARSHNRPVPGTKPRPDPLQPLPTNHATFTSLAMCVEAIGSAMLLSSLDFAVWSLYLEKLEPHWAAEAQPEQQIRHLLFSAYCVKCVFSEESAFFLPYCTGIISNFGSEFREFLQSRPGSARLGLPPTVLSGRFLLLTQFPEQRG